MQQPATFSPRKNNSNRFCCVPQCSSKARRDITARFHEFPKDGETAVIQNIWGERERVNRRKAWIHRLKIGKTVTKSMVVCSKHFLRSDYILPDVPAKQRHLKKSAIPSLNLPIGSTHDLTVKKPSRQRPLQSLKTLVEHHDIGCGGDVERETEEHPVISPEEHEAAQVLVSLGETFPAAKASIEVQATPETRDFGCQVSSGEFRRSFTDIIATPKTLVTFTGIDSFFKVFAIVNIFSLKCPESNRSSFSNHEKVVMTLMKLKLNWSYAVLSVLFGCTPTTCKNIICSSLPPLASILQCGIVWPSKENILINMPKCFDKFRKVRVILDCTEVYLSKFKCLKCRILSYSQYKGQHTIKYLIGVTPGGIISFVSAGYGGRASDRKIFEESNILNLLEPYVDEVMVDKGFLIKSLCEEQGIGVIHPPFLRKKSVFSKAEAVQTAEIAKARVHVERVIERLKKFKIMGDGFPMSMVKYSDEIITIISGLTNFSRPILSEERFRRV